MAYTVSLQYNRLDGAGFVHYMYFFQEVSSMFWRRRKEDFFPL